MITSMKMINCSGWALHNKLKASMLIEPSVGANYLITRSYLMGRYYVSSFYSRLYVAGGLFR